jgi:hypothetical protein
MRLGKFDVDVRIVIGVALALLFLGVLLAWPWSRPRDEVVKLHIDPAYNALQRTLLRAKNREPSNAWGRHGSVAYNPQSVTLKSDGPAFDAYVLDLSALDARAQVEFFMDASRRIEAGEELEESSTIARRLDVNEASFGLAWAPFGTGANYMLIVHGDQPTEVTATVSYGGPAAR